MRAQCYFQGCAKPGITKEHVPPRSFFPEDQRVELLTVPSCAEHNNAKSGDDTYVLAQICLHASPANQSRSVFQKRIIPQLGFNQGAFRRMLAKGAVPLGNGAVAYPVDSARFDRFFTALSCGIVYKAAKRSLPSEYSANHVYHNLISDGASREERAVYEALTQFYDADPDGILDFGKVKTLNTTIYTAKLFGLPSFASSLTVVHLFFGMFRVTSMLSRRFSVEPGPHAAR